ncbi:MAG TPA: prolyl oligopeptidase family serine peptidase [Hyphomicrobiaceae bacterium]|nr:prolyl oligopeptidase family serine peptidase [Hyphomicrobiaceae bacterium]
MPESHIPPDDDPFLWLEEVEGERALAFARAETAATKAALMDEAFARDREIVRAIMTAPDKIPFVSARGDRMYNFWTDADHVRGLWRRTTLESYRSPSPDWETILDIDVLNKTEGANWVWAGCHALGPQFERGLVSLSNGGSDAAVVREFDLEAKAFVPGGFALAEAKSSLDWLDPDTVLVATNLAPAKQTTSGYPREVRRWRRGDPFERSEVIYACDETDMGTWVMVERGPGPTLVAIHRVIDFFSREVFLWREGAPLVRLDLPRDAEPLIRADRLVITLKSDWAAGGWSFAKGSVIAISLARFLAGDREFAVLFEPTPRSSVQALLWIRSGIVLTVLDNVQSRIEIAREAGDRWRVEPLAGLPAGTTTSTMAFEADDAASTDRFFVVANGFLTPATLYLAEAGTLPVRLKEASARFDPSGLTVRQHEAVSSDGERIPYFEVARDGLAPDGSSATLIQAYGGFDLSMLPGYQATTGRLWLERGGVLVVANLRGGGEFGPRWHEAGRLAGKKQSHDDLAAVAADIARRGVSRPERIAAVGGSNGGLLVGSMLTRYPERFGAIVCGVPLLDMRRYTKLPPGASWIAEYGDPDKPEDWAFMQAFSPYQQLAAGRPYPPILLHTSTRDDRVHPGHARKFTARLRALGYEPVFYENEDGGHAGAADHEAVATRVALEYAFLRRALRLAVPA